MCWQVALIAQSYYRTYPASTPLSDWTHYGLNAFDVIPCSPSPIRTCSVYVPRCCSPWSVSHSFSKCSPSPRCCNYGLRAVEKLSSCNSTLKMAALPRCDSASPASSVWSTSSVSSGRESLRQEVKVLFQFKRNMPSGLNLVFCWLTL